MAEDAGQWGLGRRTVAMRLAEGGVGEGQSACSCCQPSCQPLFSPCVAPT